MPPGPNVRPREHGGVSCETLLTPFIVKVPNNCQQQDHNANGELRIFVKQHMKKANLPHGFNWCQDFIIPFFNQNTSRSWLVKREFWITLVVI